MISFDIIVWRTKLAPLWIQKSGLKWSDIPGAKKDVEAVCKDKSGFCMDGTEGVC